MDKSKRRGGSTTISTLDNTSQTRERKRKRWLVCQCLFFLFPGCCPARFPYYTKRTGILLGSVYILGIVIQPAFGAVRLSGCCCSKQREKENADTQHTQRDKIVFMLGLPSFSLSASFTGKTRAVNQSSAERMNGESAGHALQNSSWHFR